MDESKPDGKFVNVAPSAGGGYFVDVSSFRPVFSGMGDGPFPSMKLEEFSYSDNVALTFVHRSSALEESPLVISLLRPPNSLSGILEAIDETLLPFVEKFQQQVRE